MLHKPLLTITPRAHIPFQLVNTEIWESEEKPLSKSTGQIPMKHESNNAYIEHVQAYFEPSTVHHMTLLLKAHSHTCNRVRTR